MASRWGLGPVFAFEWLMTARRWQLYAARAIFLLALLAGMYLVWAQEVARLNRSTLQLYAFIGERFFYAIIGIQLTLVMLAAPAATAGAVCLDKARGALVHLLVTDLSNAEIILGKLASRLVTVLGLIGCTIPLLFLSTFFGGIHPEALIGAFFVTVAVAIFGCAFALTISVWASKAYEVLLTTYIVWIVVILANFMWGRVQAVWGIPGPPGWFSHISPYWIAFGPYVSDGVIELPQQLTYAGILSALSALVLLPGVILVRWVTIRHTGRPSRPASRSWIFARLSPRKLWFSWPSLDRSPLLWCEWRCRRPSWWTLAVWLFYILGAGLASVVALVEASMAGWFRTQMAILVNATQLTAGLLLLSISAVTALADDRMRGTVDVLLATPVSSSAIVRSKWLSGARLVLPVAFFPIAVGFGIVCNTRAVIPFIVLVVLVLAYGAATASLGLALATWIRRYGRAIAASVTIYLLASIGFIMVPILTVSAPGEENIGVFLCGSPFYGTAVLTAAVAREFPQSISPQAWGFTWIIIYGVIALILYAATLLTFDRCLGRIPGRARGKTVHAFDDSVLEPLAAGRETS
jgi:ABC-type transport system involved in multi-copper enzyme maturation permease subunit